jgi:hypothetical protein
LNLMLIPATSTTNQAELMTEYTLSAHSWATDAKSQVILDQIIPRQHHLVSCATHAT